MNTVLVVDDDPVIRRLLATLLRRRGFRIAEAANGEEALACLEEARDRVPPFAAILLDLMMPRVSGFEVLAYIEANLPHLLRRVVVVSAAGDARLDEIRRRVGATILPKPFDSAELEAALSTCLAAPGPDATDLLHFLLPLLIAFSSLLGG